MLDGFCIALYLVFLSNIPLAAYQKMRTIKLQAYNERWSSEFLNESIKIRSSITNLYMTFHHIGSTAIKGMMSKPTIDILIEVSSLAEVDSFQDKFEELGYIPKGEFGITGRRFFYKGEEVRTHHLHIFESGNPEIQRYINFVDFLNNHPIKAREYESLKIELAIKYKSSPNEYSKEKSAFVRQVEIEARLA